MKKKEKNKIFISDCGNFIAIEIPNSILSFDVWREDGSEFWEGTKYVKAPGSKGLNSRMLYTEEHAQATKIVGSCSNLGHKKRDGTWVERWELGLYDIQTGEGIRVPFESVLESLAPLYRRRRGEGEKRKNEKER